MIIASLEEHRCDVPSNSDRFNAARILTKIEDLIETPMHENFVFDELIYLQFSNKFFMSFYLQIFDMSVAHKGSMLQATPAVLKIEHYVFVISQCKGGTICYTPNSLRNFWKNTQYKYKYTKYFFGEFVLTTPKIFINKMHAVSQIKMKLQNDVETNPGPENKIKLNVITQNCNGLGNIDKMRLLLNKIKALSVAGDQIVMLQETMIATDNYIKLAWRGKYILTPGTGNSKG